MYINACNLETDSSLNKVLNITYTNGDILVPVTIKGKSYSDITKDNQLERIYSRISKTIDIVSKKYPEPIKHMIIEV